MKDINALCAQITYIKSSKGHTYNGFSSLKDAIIDLEPSLLLLLPPQQIQYMDFVRSTLEMRYTNASKVHMIGIAGADDANLYRVPHYSEYLVLQVEGKVALETPFGDIISTSIPFNSPDLNRTNLLKHNIIESNDVLAYQW